MTGRDLPIGVCKRDTLTLHSASWTAHNQLLSVNEEQLTFTIRGLALRSSSRFVFMICFYFYDASSSKTIAALCSEREEGDDTATAALSPPE